MTRILPRRRPATHLGRAIVSELEDLDMTQAELAHRLGVSPAAVTNLIHRYDGDVLTIPTALSLEHHLGRSAREWLDLALKDARK